jgi:flagellar P-ring protein precursor FlgI
MTLSRWLGLVAPLVLFWLSSFAGPANAARIKDIAQVEGARPNQLVGYGLAVGLDGTGDTIRSNFTIQSLVAMLSRMGVRVESNLLMLRNVAAVTVTATLPPFSQPGTSIDVVVSSIGDARSLVGGTLLLTPLLGVDGKTYALAQGPVQVGGYGVQGNSGSRVQKNQLNVGRIASGAIVERAVPTQLLTSDGSVVLQLRRPDFTTAQRMVEVINQGAANLGGAKAIMDGSGAVRVAVPEPQRADLGAFLALLEAMELEPDASARVVINSRTGTVVLGQSVRISTVAVSHGGLTLEVQEAFDVSQPNALAAGNTVVTPNSAVNAAEKEGALKLVNGAATIADVVAALNALGAKPRDLIDILQAIAAAGALHAELEVL